MTFSKFDWYRSLAGADITDTEFRVLVLLANYADGKTGGNAHPSATTLAVEAGKSAKTIRRSLASLVDRGWLTKVERDGSSSVYQLATLDTQMSRVTESDHGHPDVQGSEGTLDKSGPTLDTQMSNPPGHPDVHRSDQGSDPSRIRSIASVRSDPGGRNTSGVQPAEDQDAVAGTAIEDPFADEGERLDARDLRAVPPPSGSGHEPDWRPPRRAGSRPSRRSFGDYANEQKYPSPH